jgi:hypothetical protein
MEDLDALVSGRSYRIGNLGASVAASGDVDVIDDADDVSDVDEPSSRDVDDDEIDRVSLLREFSELLQDRRAAADG